jgi:hypothetical protein
MPVKTWFCSGCAGEKTKSKSKVGEDLVHVKVRLLSVELGWGLAHQSGEREAGNAEKEELYPEKKGWSSTTSSRTTLVNR